MTTPAKEPGSQSLDLRGIDLLENLNAAARRELERRALIRQFAPDELLWREGTPAGALHIVLSGEVRVVRANDGRQRVMHRESRGGTLGDVALFSNAPYPATAIAVTRVTTLALTPDTLHALIAADPALALKLLARLAQRVRHVLGVIDRMTTWSVQARLADHLLQRARAAETFTLGMTQQALAEELGTVREVIVRTLAEFRAGGCIQSTARGRYRITDRKALEQFANPAR